MEDALSLPVDLVASEASDAEFLDAIAKAEAPLDRDAG